MGRTLRDFSFLWPCARRAVFFVLNVPWSLACSARKGLVRKGSLWLLAKRCTVTSVVVVQVLNPSTSGGRGRQLSEFEASLVYRVSSRTARAIQRNPVLKKQANKKQPNKKRYLQTLLPKHKRIFPLLSTSGNFPPK